MRRTALLAVAVLLTACGAPGSGDVTTLPTPEEPPSLAPDWTATPGATSEAPAGTAVYDVGAPEDVVTGLTTPWSVVFAGDTPLVSERDTGRVLEITAAGARVVGEVPGIVHGGEGGLLGLALDGQGHLYAYSTGGHGNRVQRFPLLGAPGSYSLGPGVTVLDGIPSAANHNGGRIAFGPDGMLYVGTGDAGNRADAQDLGSLGGKILRMTRDGGVPADNPFPGSFVYSYGHRNVQGLAWAVDGTMVASEFGQDTWDELNVVVPGGNYGWPVVEGVADDPAYVNPVQQWRTSEASPSGIAVVGGTVFVANLRGTRLRAVPLADPGGATEAWVGEHGRLRAVTQAPDGSLWVLTNNTDGRGSPRAGDDRILRAPLIPRQPLTR